MSGMRDDYGSHMQRTTDEYGNPIHHQQQGYGTGSVSGGYGTAAGGAGVPVGHTTTLGTDSAPYEVGAGGQLQQTRPVYTMEDHRDRGGLTGMLHRSGSGSSSSSEDDGEGGRRKKGLKEKIKDKIPGMHSSDHEEQRRHDQAPAAGVAAGYGADGSHGTEHKGMMEKIKEKIPGMHHGSDHDNQAAHGGVVAGGYSSGYGGGPAADDGHEKKGMMEKIKEKLPGHHE